MAAGFLDKFFIQYLTNAKQAAADTRDFDKANNELAEGTKKLTDEERKRNKEIESTARALTDVVAGITAAAAAYVGLAAVKNGVVKAADFNNTLYLQNKLLGQSSQEVAALGAMMQKFGGTAEGFNSWLSNTTMEFNALGISLPQAGVFLRTINQQLQGMSQTEKNFQLSRLGITDPAMILMLSQATEEFEKQYAAKVRLNAVTQAGQEAANKFSAAYGDLKDALNVVFSKIEEQVLPLLSKVTEKFSHWISDNPKLAEGILLVGSAITTLIGIVASRGLIAALFGIGAAATAASLPFLGWALAIGAVVTGLGLLASAVTNSGLGDGGSTAGSGGGGGRLSKSNFAAAQKAMDFWKTQGYDAAGSAGWAANMLAESGGDPTKSVIDSDGKLHSGLFQWSPERVALIRAGTGIDVRNASFEDQLKAAAWEAEQRGDAARVRQQLSPDAASGVITKNFLRPANADWQSIIRGKSAIDIANNSPLSSGGVTQTSNNSRSVQMDVGGIHVSGAGDPHAVAQNVNDVLNSHFRDTISNFDDGVDK